MNLRSFKLLSPVINLTVCSRGGEGRFMPDQIHQLSSFMERNPNILVLLQRTLTFVKLARLGHRSISEKVDQK